MLRKFLILMAIPLLFSCGKEKDSTEIRELSTEFQDYWFAGQAEITTYELKQARYGEMRNGHATLIYVTEDFLPKEQVKANQQNDSNIPVLKLNSTKKFLTGIYPYSIMQSCFDPLYQQDYAIKISASIQEWCGQVYMQLNNHKDFEITLHSYFQGEADERMNLTPSKLENEVWTQLRIEPDSLPTGNFEMIPSFEYLRLSHQPVKAYPAFGEIYTEKDWNVYRLNYEDLNRTLKIYYSKVFPFTIEKWEETYPSGSGKSSELLTTSAVKLARLKTDYWNKNSNKNLSLRDSLKLKNE